MKRTLQIVIALLLAGGIGYLLAPSILEAQNPPLGTNQGSTTAGTPGRLDLGTVSINPQNYATGQNQPLNLDTMGSLKVNIATAPNLTVTATPSADPCTSAAKSATPINSAASATNQLLVAGSAGKKVFVCAISFISAASINFNLVEGAGSGAGINCTIGTSAIIGSTIATQGQSIATQGGFTLGSGNGTVAQSAVASDSVCAYVSPSAQFGGVITYVQQ